MLEDKPCFRRDLKHNQRVTFTVETEQESDGRWIAEIPQIPGAMSYGATRVLAALLRIGWSIKREAAGSHRILSRPGWPDTVFAFHDSEEDWSYSRRLMKTRDASNEAVE